MGMSKNTQQKIGFVGQGYIGKNMADDYKNRGFSVVRYSLEAEYIDNRNEIESCDIVFVAVPTPTNKNGSDYSIVQDAVGLVGDGKIAVIKSTVPPGTSEKIQKIHPEKIVLFSPEFLSKASAVHDAKNPICNIIGIINKTDRYVNAAARVHETLPFSDNVYTVSTKAAEHYKYIHNVHGYLRIVAANIFYDGAQKLDVDWEEIKTMMDSNPMMSPYYNQPVHQSGRGAGGCCFIKDYAAFRMTYEKLCPEDAQGIKLLQALEQKNLSLLQKTGKDADIVSEIYRDLNNT